MKLQLIGEVALVTGADSGIGAATAVALAKAGADVAITYYHDRDGAEQTRREVEDEGRRGLVLQLDQKEPGQVAQLFTAVREQLGDPVILVNNAGINASGVTVKDMPLEDWDRALRTNLHGPFYCCQQFIRALDGTGKAAAIINITSVHEEIPMPGAAGYDAAKGGLRNLTRTLALELGEDNITVNNIAPGMILTPMNQAAREDPAQREKQVQSIPVKRAGEPEEVASAVVFLASTGARYIHGSTLVVDGGLMQFMGQGA